MRLLVARLVLLLLTEPALAGQIGSAAKVPVQQACPASGDMPADFASAVSASSFLTRDGREIRLAGVIGPGEDGSPISPEMVAATRSALATVLQGHELRLAVIDIPDRYQRISAEVFADGGWVQRMMLRGGMVRADPGRSAGLCDSALYSAERDAIQSRSGHWGDERFRVKTPDEVTKSAGRFEIVEGEVWRSRDFRGRQVLEFRNASSFQVEVKSQAIRTLRLTHVDLRRLRGKTVRVRGWIGLDDRPVMEISKPAALEVVQK